MLFAVSSNSLFPRLNYHSYSLPSIVTTIPLHIINHTMQNSTTCLSFTNKYIIPSSSNICFPPLSYPAPILFTDARPLFSPQPHTSHHNATNTQISHPLFRPPNLVSHHTTTPKTARTTTTIQPPVVSRHGVRRRPRDRGVRLRRSKSLSSQVLPSISFRTHNNKTIASNPTLVESRR